MHVDDNDPTDQRSHVRKIDKCYRADAFSYLCTPTYPTVSCRTKRERYERRTTIAQTRTKQTLSPRGVPGLTLARFWRQKYRSKQPRLVDDVLAGGSRTPCSPQRDAYGEGLVRTLRVCRARATSLPSARPTIGDRSPGDRYDTILHLT